LTVLRLGMASAWAAAPRAGAQLNGEQLYQQHCAQCHTSSRAIRAPQLTALRIMGPQDVLDTLELGTMKFVGFKRTAEERRAIAEFVTGKKLEQEQEGKETLAGRCEQDPGDFDPTKGPHWNGWGAGLANARFQSAEDAGLTADQVPRLKVKWAF